MAYIWPFAFGGILVLILALSTVLWLISKVAKGNPVESLRYE